MNTLKHPTTQGSVASDSDAFYPLQFTPFFEYRLWGGRRLAHWMSNPLSGDGPIGEAWLLSDRDDHASMVSAGTLKGITIQQLMQRSPSELLGKYSGRFDRFPLLLKFLDAQQVLSVQVHPSDANSEYIPAGESGKTEAWVVLEAGKSSQIYAGLKPGTTPQSLQQALDDHTVSEQLASFKAAAGDAVFIQSGTVHSLCDLVVFEIQQNSDITFRLDDWGRIDSTTGKHRALQQKEAMACIDFSQLAISAIAPVVDNSSPTHRERLFDCEHFVVDRVHADAEFTIDLPDAPVILVSLGGSGQVEYNGTDYPLDRGDCMLLPAILDHVSFRPGESVNLLELSFA